MSLRMNMAEIEWPHIDHLYSTYNVDTEDLVIICDDMMQIKWLYLFLFVWSEFKL